MKSVQNNLIDFEAMRWNAFYNAAHNMAHNGSGFAAAIAEAYYKADKNTPLPNWHVSVDEVLADNKAPISVTSEYNQNTFIGFSTIYTTNNKEVHFLTSTKEITNKPAGKIW